MKKRFLAMLLALIMVLGLLPVSAMAYRPFKSVPLTLNVSSYSAPFINGNTGEHTVGSYKAMEYVSMADVGSVNSSGSATARFVGSNKTGWTLVIDVVIGNYMQTWTTNARITNKDMSNATGSVTFGLSFNTPQGTSTYLHISGAATRPSTGAPSGDFGSSVVTVHCKTNSDHADQSYPLKAGTYTAVNYNTGDLTCTVNVDATQYVSLYGNNHTLDDTTPKSLELKWDGTKWNVNGSVKFDVKCESVQPPVAPEAKKDFDKEDAVKVECTTVGSHSETYDLIDNSYSVTNPVKNEDGSYTSTVTIYAAKYIEAYKAAHSDPEHTEVDTTSKTINLKWTSKETGWQIVSDNKTTPYATFTVKCTPPVPTEDNTYGALDNAAVTVNCSTVPSHSKTYKMEKFTSTTPVKEGDTYTSKITVSYDDYGADFQNLAHTRTSVSSVVIEVKWDGEKWVKKDDGGKVRAEFTVKCTATDPLNNLELDDFIKVVDKGVHTEEKIYPLYNDTYTTDYDAATDYTAAGAYCTVTISNTRYTESYNNDVAAGHSFDSFEDDKKTFQITWNSTTGKWEYSGDTPAVTINVKCTPEPNYTLTLKYDANGGSGAPADDVYVGPNASNVFAVSNVEPTRANYTFLGWADTANATSANVGSTVTVEAVTGTTSGEKTIYAVWKENITPPVNYTLTLKYDANGGSGAPTADVYVGPNASNVFTVSNVEPTRANYTFLGWADTANATRANVGRTVTVEAVTGTTSGEKTIYAVWSWNYYPIYRPVKATPKFNTTDHFAYVQGYPNGSVKPTGNITRAETAAILFRLMDEGTRNTYYSTKSGFRDVSSNNWFNTYVATLNAAGVITDSANGYFRPNDAITRAELAAMLAQFADTKSAANYFNDVAANQWAANAIAVCAKLGWINGYPDGSFRPDNYITRAELMAMINRATGRTPKTADAFLNGMKTWTDNLDTTKWYYVDVQEATNSHDYIGALNEKWTALRSAPNWSVYE